MASLKVSRPTHCTKFPKICAVPSSFYSYLSTLLESLHSRIGALLEMHSFLSPADLSESLGYPDNAGHPDVQAIIEQAIRKICAAGKAAGFLAVDPAMAKRCLEWGATFVAVAVGVDTMLYSEVLDRRLALFKPMASDKAKLTY